MKCSAGKLLPIKHCVDQFLCRSGTSRKRARVFDKRKYADAETMIIRAWSKGKRGLSYAENPCCR
jgi:hypothetical protein